MAEPYAPTPEAPTRETFRVDLRGIVDILSHHLYSSPRVYLREVLQNARDALAARGGLHGDETPRIDVVPARGGSPLEIRDNGVGLTAAEMRELLATVGGSSKRHDLEVARAKFLGQFGIGLFSCFLVADRVEVVSRSAREPDAPTIRWVGHSDGTYTIEEGVETLESPGSVVRLQPRHGELDWCTPGTVAELARDFAEFLDVPVHVDGELVSQVTPPWELPVEEQLAWCRERMGFEAMGIIALESAMLDVRGIAFVLPFTAEPGLRTGDRIYSRGVLVSASDDQILPSWAFFCRAVIDAGSLPLTASREALLETTSLDFVRGRLGDRLLSELILVQGQHPDVYQDIVRLHSSGLKTLAVSSADMRGLMRSTLPLETTLGHRTIEQLQRRGGEIRYVTDHTTYRALADVAAHAEALVMDASGVADADLLTAVGEETPGLVFREIGPEHVLELAQLRPPTDPDAAAQLVTLAQDALAPAPVQVVVAGFAPAERPTLWAPGRTDGDERAPETLVLDADNDAVVRMMTRPHRRTPALLRAYYVLGRLLAGAPVADADARTLTESLHTFAASGS